MSFRTSRVYNSVNKVRDFIFADIEKVMDLVHAEKAAPNFLIALGLCCYTEYWGKLVKGIAVGHSEECFNEFFDRLGSCYKDLRQTKNVDVYHHIRCGLAHAYIIEGNDSIIDMKRGSCGIEYDPISISYRFHIPTYIEDFKKAVTTFIDGLDTGSEDLSLIEQALEHKPELI